MPGQRAPPEHLEFWFSRQWATNATPGTGPVYRPPRGELRASLRERADAAGRPTRRQFNLHDPATKGTGPTCCTPPPTLVPTPWTRTADSAPATGSRAPTCATSSIATP